VDAWEQGDWFEFQEQSNEEPDAGNGEPQDHWPEGGDAEGGESFLEVTDDTLYEQAPEPGTSGSFRMPPIPSRPLGPNRSYISGAPASPYRDQSHDQSQGWYDSDAKSHSRPLPMGSAAFGNPPSPPPGRGYQRAARAASDGSGSSQGGWRRAWILLLGAALLLIICVSAGMLTGFLPQILRMSGTSGSNNHPGGIVLDSPTATPTATAIPTATPIVPTAATITFSAATTQRSSSGSMTSCPSGCNIVGVSYSNSQSFSSSNPATPIPQSSLIGTIHVVNASNTPWSVSTYAFSGGGYTCAAQSVFVSAFSNRDFTCFIGISSPSSLPANTIKGTAATSVTYTQPGALVGDAHYEVLSSDCQAALSDLHNNQGKLWAQAWFAGQSAPAGWKFALGSPSITFSGDSCPTGEQHTSAFNFTASTTTTVHNAAYNPAAAQSLASSRLDGTLPGGYQWQTSTRTTCTPSVKSVNSSNKVTLNCSDSGVAYYIWTRSAQSQLASKLAGHTKTQALATCNKTAGVRANTCAISIIGGDGTVLPESADALVITAKGP
jgi:hypothetical protein